jgi:glutaredoxin 2
MKNWIERKNKNLEIIQERIDEEFQKNHTFTPQINFDKKSSVIKRNFDQFLEDQANYKKRLTDKISMVKYLFKNVC